jgi:CheY-like chemotaxis protein
MAFVCASCDYCRVLHVDDNRDVANSSMLLLQCLGAHARVAYDGEVALAMIPEFKPHLVLMDIGMPGMDGCETARRIRQLPEGKSLVLAALTAWSHEDARRQTAEAGFDQHFVKPLAVEALEKLLASLQPGCTLNTAE